MNLQHATVGTRLAAGFAIVLGLLALIAALACQRLNAVSTEVTVMVDQLMQKQQLFAEWAASTDLNGARTISAVALPAGPALQAIQTNIKATSAHISDLQKALELLPKAAAEGALLDEVGARRSQYVTAREAALQQKKTDEAQAADIVRSRLEPALAAYVASIRKLSAYQAEALRNAAARTESDARHSTLLLAGLSTLTVLLGGGVAALISRSVKRQLGGEPGRAVALANGIASGDLTLDIAVHAGDQDSLMFALKSMRDSIAAIVAQVRSGTDTIATASAQIASGNLDLSSRTEEQASSLEETASAMEQLTATVRQNADNAGQARQLALAASAVASQGGAAVQQVVATMAAIDVASRKIGDIIGVIDGIAFQTNILALNAAVEAARAGEQGRGFAVVAGEVRNLAHRAAAAAKDIKALIGDAAGQVTQGGQLSNEAGATMDQVVGSVTRVSDIIAEISAASDEQRLGIEQVNLAIGQMDDVTQQNAALVEEAAAASASLQVQASELAGLVSVFRLPGIGAEVAKAPAAARAPRRAALPETARPALARPATRIRADAAAEWEAF